MAIFDCLFSSFSLRQFLRKKPTNQRSEQPAKKKKSMYGNDRVKFLLAVQYHYKVIFQATRSHFISKLTTIKTFYNNNVLLSLEQRNSADSGLFTRLCHNHSERYRPRLDNFLLGTSNRSLHLIDK